MFVTFNNLACYYKQIGKHWVALGYLQESLVLEKQQGNQSNIAELFLNICAVFSTLGKH